MNPSLPEWVPDDSVGHCQRCIVPFTLTNRKHHCRACGRVVCHGCSPHRIALQPNIPDEKVRVCEDCKDEREQAEAAAAEVSANIEAKASELEPPSSSTASTIAKPLLNVASPVPVATSPISSPQAPASLATVAGVAGKPVPVAATAPRVVLPTAAVVASRPASTSGSGSGGFFSGLSKKLEKHAPGLVAAVKEHVAAATTKHEEQRLEKHAHAERIIAQADASTAAANSGAALSPLLSSSTVISPAVLPSVPVKSASISSVSSGGSGNIAHIPGLGAIALAPSPSNEEDKEDSAWSQLARQPAAANVDPEAELPADAELRRRHHPKGDIVDVRRKSLTDQSISLTESAPLATDGLSSSSSSSSSSSLKLDLPLRLCLVILKKTAHEMREKYSEYLLTKQRRAEGDEPLSFHQFMFFSTIRTLPEFLFKKTELAFCMMREEGDTLVFRDNFVRYAPILAPLASRLDADKLYLCLEHASIQSGAALTLEQVQQQEEEDEYQAIEAHTHGNAKLPIQPPTPRIRRKVGGVAYAPFKIYVDALKKHSHPDTCQWPDFKHFGAEFGMDRHEQLLCVRTGVADTTHFPPRIGRLGLTTNFLLYEPSFLKGKRGIRWSSITRIETNEEGFWKKTVASATGAGSAISPASASTAASTHSPTHDKNATSGETKGFKVYVLSDDHATDDSQTLTHTGIPQPKEHCIALDIPGWSIETVFQRQRTYEYMRILVHLHRLVASIPDKVVSSALVQETTQTIVRMRSLESVGNGCNPLLLNPFPGYVMDVNSHQQKKHAKRKSVGGSVGVGGDDLSPDSTSFVSSISASISRSEAIRKSKSSWLFAVLPGLQNKEQESLEEDIDPEVAAQNYKTAEELLKLQQQHEQPFSLKNFAYNVKLFRYEIEPLMLFIALIKRVRDWENPIVTLMTVLILLNMAYRDLLQYLPALLILINIGIVATLRYYPNAVWVALGGPQSEAAAAAAAAGSSNTAPSTATIVELDESKEENELTLTDTEGNTVSATAASSSKAPIPTAQPVTQPKKDSDREGLFAKLKNYRDVAVKTKDYLHSVQNSVAEQNVRFMQVEGLYKWRSPLVTQKFFIMLCAGFLVMVFIPFRFIFPLIVIDFFTTKWQRSGSLERLLNEVPLPARMPEID